MHRKLRHFQIAYIDGFGRWDCLYQFLGLDGLLRPILRLLPASRTNGVSQRGGSHSGEAWLLSICDEKSHTLSHASTAGATHRGHINRNRNKLKAFLFEALHMSMCQRWLMTSDYCREPSVRKVGFEGRAYWTVTILSWKKTKYLTTGAFQPGSAKSQSLVEQTVSLDLRGLRFQPKFQDEQTCKCTGAISCSKVQKCSFVGFFSKKKQQTNVRELWTCKTPEIYRELCLSKGSKQEDVPIRLLHVATRVLPGYLG